MCVCVGVCVCKYVCVFGRARTRVCASGLTCLAEDAGGVRGADAVVVVVGGEVKTARPVDGRLAHPPVLTGDGALACHTHGTRIKIQDTRYRIQDTRRL